MTVPIEPGPPVRVRHLRQTQRITASSDSSVRTVAGPLNANQAALHELQTLVLELQERVERLEER